MYTKPDNLQRTLLLKFGRLLYRMGLARFIIGLTPNRIRVMLYHAVEDTESGYTQGLGASVSCSMFEHNMAYFAQHYSVIPVSTLGPPRLDLPKSGSSDIPKRALIITFDDGYTTVRDNALPSLKKYNLPACIYLIGRAVDNRLVWVNQLTWAMSRHRQQCQSVVDAMPELEGHRDLDSLILYIQNNFSPAQIELLMAKLEEQIQFETDHHLYLKHHEILEMQSDGIEFGFHTLDHYNLENCDQAMLAQQFDSTLVDELTSNNTFAYPFGFFSPDAVKCATDKGYDRLMTVGNNNDRFSDLHLDRIEVTSADPAVVFAHLEVVEPVITLLRRVYLKLKPAPKN